MLKLIIEDDEGRKTVVPFVRDEITIGRQEGNTIRLTERNVSRRHARLVRLNGHVVVEDLGSYNGTRINGERIAGQSPLKEGDLVQIGDYDLALQTEAAANPSGPITAKVPTPRRAEPVEEDEAPDGAGPDEEDGDEHDHTPLPAAAERRHATAIIRLDHVEADRPRKVEVVPPEERPRLVILSPQEFKGQEFDCVRTELKIGRTQENDIALDHRSLSRTHAKVVREESGDWRVIDMQSANGLTVNGESYAQATLSSGDVVELGHVKMRFLAAGEVPQGLDDDGEEGGGRSKLPLVAALILLIAGGAAGTYFVMRPPADGTPVPPVEVAQPTPDPAADPTEAQKPPETVVEAPPPEKPPESPVAPTIAPEQEKLQRAQEAVAAKDFEQAVRILESIKDAKGARPKDAEELLQRARAEQLMDQKLTLAQKSLDEGKLEDAAKALRESEGTTAYADRFTALTAKLDAARKKAAETAAAQATPPPEKPDETPKPNVRPASANAGQDKVQAQVDELLADCKTLLKGRQYEAALKQAKECARLAPKLPDCQLMLGSAHAWMGDKDKGAEHYRKFLELAPANHPQRAGVEKALGSYK